MFGSYKNKTSNVIEMISQGEFSGAASALDNDKTGMLYKHLTDKLIRGKADISTLIKNIFQIAANISAFDLKLGFHSRIMNAMADDIHAMSDSLNTALKETALAINQITASNSELTSAMSHISERSRAISDSVNNSSRKIEEISSEGEQVLKVADTMKHDFDSLAGIMHEMESTVQSIYEISDQTNLLALNASIEAARAGESGKGFSVVANEIRKLSDTTKSSLNAIDVLMKNIQEALLKSNISTKETISSVSHINAAIETISNNFAENTSSINGMADDISSISAQNEELNASLEEISATTDSLLAEASKLKDISQHLKESSRNVEAVSGEIKDIEMLVDAASKMGGTISAERLFGLSNEDFLESVNTAIVAHIKWVEILKSIVDDMQIKPLQIDDHKCGFGHFYHSVKLSSEKIITEWKSIDEYHHNLHALGGIVMEDVRNNNKADAVNKYQEAKNISEQIVKKFQDIISVVEKMGAEKVF